MNNDRSEALLPMNTFGDNHEGTSSAHDGGYHDEDGDDCGLESFGLMDFPDELLWRIFSFLSAADLSRVSQVNRRCRNIGEDRQLWCNVKELNFTRDTTAETIEDFIRRCPRLRSLNLSSNRHVTDLLLENIFGVLRCNRSHDPDTSFLQQLNLQNIEYSDRPYPAPCAPFEDALHSGCFQDLLEIRLCKHIVLSERALADLFVHNLNLRRLHLSGMREPFLRGFHRVAQRRARSSESDSEEDTNEEEMSDSDAEELEESDEDMEPTPHHHVGLQVNPEGRRRPNRLIPLVSEAFRILCLDRCSLHVGVIDSMLQAFPNLAELSLSSCQTFGLETRLQHLLQLHNLRRLEFENAAQVLPRNFVISDPVAPLAVVRLENCGVMETFECHCETLTKLSLVKCSALRRVRIFAPSLKRLTLNWLSLQRLNVECREATELVLWHSSLPAHTADLRLCLPQLQRLDLSGWKRIPEQLIEVLESTSFSSLVTDGWMGVGSNLPSFATPTRMISSLQMSGCPYLNSSDIKALIVANAKTLELVDLSNCPKLSSAQQIVDLCGPFQLRRLNFAGSGGGELRLLGCPLLEYVDVSSSEIHTLTVDLCPRLHTLSVDHCSKLQHAHVNAPQLVLFEKSLCPFESLVLNTPRLRALSFENLWHLSSFQLPQLESLDLVKFPDLTTDELVRLLAVVQPAHLGLSACKKVTSLHLKSDRLRSVSLSGLRALSRLQLDTPHLDTLSVAWCPRIQLSLVCLLVSSLPELRLLYVQGFNRGRDLALSSPSLQQISVSQCLALKSLSFACPRLGSILVEGCRGIVEASVECEDIQIVRVGSASFRSLQLKHCKQIGKWFAKNLPRVMPSLDSLELIECTRLHPEALQLLVEQLRSLKTLRLRKPPSDGTALGSLSQRLNCPLPTLKALSPELLIDSDYL
eukprot:CAMPEP_0174242462 /NCGR_PEP_ID=MMETSP0417-20130205/27962_1 /TAXON_ID=242541 /ORGANISM="Mayorella sp, Strain BSH-02190019" /LENGTH=921 /DNA_ID=CAMNT_0015321857 /DNA_START=61 /DNA_END=2826 /DNA_ORIENTATION=-